MKKLLFATAFAFAAISGNKAVAQEEAVNPLDTLASSVQKLQSDVDILKRIQISGYMLPQFQVADSTAQSSFAGGNFNANTDKRFMLREARLKAVYATELTQFVFQLDVSEKGGDY